jgi:two-component system OmpR family response regulator
VGTTVNERILLIDDDASVLEVARLYLERDGYIVYTATNGRDGLSVAATRQPALYVVDLFLPDVSGEAVLQEIRRRSEVPVLMLSGRAGADERIQGLSLGADDYLTKPFSPRELVARVKALLRRGGGQAASRDLLTFDDGVLEIDAVRHEVRVAGRRCDVTPSEYKLLMALADRPGRVYSRAELAYKARGHDFVGYERTVDAHIKNLRRKIEDDPANPAGSWWSRAPVAACSRAPHPSRSWAAERRSSWSPAGRSGPSTPPAARVARRDRAPRPPGGWRNGSKARCSRRRSSPRCSPSCWPCSSGCGWRGRCTGSRTSRTGWPTGR